MKPCRRYVSGPRRLVWGGALGSALLFGLLEGYEVNRGVPQAFVGLFLVVVAVVLPSQDPVRRFCAIGPPAR